MPATRTRLGSIVVLALAASIGAPSSRPASAAPGATDSASSSSAGSYTRYTRRLEAEAVRILTPEIGGPAKPTLAAHGLDLWGCLSIGEWRQAMLRWAPTTEKALTVLVRRTEVLWAEEKVNENYDSTILQLGSVHAMQKGLTRVLDASGVSAPLPLSAAGMGAGTLVHLPIAPTASHATAPAPVRLPESTPVFGVRPDRAPIPAPLPARMAAPALPPSSAPAPAPERRSDPDAFPTSATTDRPVSPGPAATRRTASPTGRNVPAAQSPYELAGYQGALARESYRVLFPEIENGAQVALAARRTQMRSADTVAEWKRLLSEANPSFTKAAAVLERRAEVLRGETKVLDAYDSPHTQRAAVYGLQSGLEKILAQYGK